MFRLVLELRYLEVLILKLLRFSLRWDRLCKAPVERGASLESGPRPCGHDTSSGVTGPTGTHLTKMNSVRP
jgi:hypothetical protein